jgi:hypothetical protein
MIQTNLEIAKYSEDKKNEELQNVYVNPEVSNLKVIKQNFISTN